MKVIECERVNKRFGKKTVFEDLNLSFEENKIYALLGRNGAGKTTLLKLIATQFLPNEGTIKINGESAYENEKVLKKLCFMTENLLGYDGYKVSKIFKIAKRFYENWDEGFKDHLCKLYQLDVEAKLGSLSKGQQTAVSLVIGMASRCPIVMFDEIYAGMDPVARAQFYDILAAEWETNPRTFVISTHLIEEMSQMFTDVVIIDKGKILIDESVEDVHQKSWKISGAREIIDALDIGKVLSRKYIGSVGEASVYGEISDSEREKMQAEGLEVDSLTLQELFLALTV
ncbi:MAG: ABC transporter ATP-binding protein [Eubacterium sp.]|jgi:ABC-type multidrug transport system, ATPase component|nr:ABC transporter ATP-binding protein [Eubacterium sp.]